MAKKVRRKIRYTRLIFALIGLISILYLCFIGFKFLFNFAMNIINPPYKFVAQENNFNLENDYLNEVENSITYSINKPKISSKIDEYYEKVINDTKLANDFKENLEIKYEYYPSYDNLKNLNIYIYKDRNLSSIKTLVYDENDNPVNMEKLLRYRYLIAHPELKNVNFNLREEGIILFDLNSTKTIDLESINSELKFKIENKIIRYHDDDKFIAFSFDDGPHNDHDRQIIELFKSYNGKATFFHVGQRIVDNADSIKLAYDNGFEIGCHTFDHPALARLSDEGLNDQIRRSKEELNKVLPGVDFTLFRPTYGAFGDRDLNLVPYPFVNWSIDTEDWKNRDAATIADIIRNQAADGDIVLLHDLYQTSVDGVKATLDELYQKGFNFVTISELARIKGRELNKGHVYYALK